MIIMAEYIDRDALLQAFCNLSTDMMDVYGEPYFEHIDGFSESKVRYIIRNFPKSNVCIEKREHWIESDSFAPTKR